MKKGIVIFLAMLILASSAGTTFALHYCGKSLQDIAVFGKASPCCEGMEMPVGCCHEEQIQVDSDDYQPTKVVAHAGFIPVQIATLSFPILDFSTQFRNSISAAQPSPDHSHPPSGPEVIILVHSFLI